MATTPPPGEDTASVLAGVAAILDALQNFSGSGGSDNRLTQDLVYFPSSGSALQSFVCPFDLDIVRIFNANTISEAKVSMNGRTAFAVNQVCGNEGGLIALVGRGNFWEGRFRVNFNDQIWINVPIGSPISFTVEHR